MLILRRSVGLIYNIFNGKKGKRNPLLVKIPSRTNLAIRSAVASSGLKKRCQWRFFVRCAVAAGLAFALWTFVFGAFGTEKMAPSDQQAAAENNQTSDKIQTPVGQTDLNDAENDSFFSWFSSIAQMFGLSESVEAKRRRMEEVARKARFVERESFVCYDDDVAPLAANDSEKSMYIAVAMNNSNACGGLGNEVKFICDRIFIVYYLWRFSGTLLNLTYPTVYKF